MSAQTQKQQETYLMYPIGTIRRSGDEIHLEIEMAPQKDLPRGKNVCTTIVT